MADKARAAEAKARGNAALSAKNYDAAIAAYTEAIAADPSDHIFFSNRSAAHLSAGDASAALADAERCVGMAPAWGKGYGRKGAALHAMHRYEEAIATYEAGLKVEPGNDGLKSGLADARAAAERGVPRMRQDANPFGAANPFGPDMFARLAANPRFAPYLADEAFIAKLRKLQASSGSQTGMQAALSGDFMSDPRMLEVVMSLLGVDPSAAEEEMPSAGTRPAASAPAPAPTSAPAPAAAANPGGGAASASAGPSNPTEETEVEMEDEETKAARAAKREAQKRAQAQKEAGNAAYKNRQFETALTHYREAAQIDPDEIIYLVNEAAVHFEMGNLDECITVCNRAVERGREIRAPFASMAKAFARIGNAKYKRGDYAGAIEAYENSLLESHTEEVHNKLKTVKAEWKKKQDLEYRDPAKAAEAKERGNEAFKAGDFPKAVAEYTEAIKRDPDNAVYWTNRAAARCKLADFNTALEDVEKALKLDPKSVRAYNRRGAIQTLMKEYHKAIESYQATLKIEADNAEAREGLNKVLSLVNQGAASGEGDPERAARAMADPEIQRILMDPMVNAALEDIKRDPNNFAKVMRDPGMASKFQKLITAGVLSVK